MNKVAKIFLMGFYWVRGKIRSKKLSKENSAYYLKKVKYYSGKPIATKEEAGKFIKERIALGTPFLVARYGYTEMFVMRTFDFKMRHNYKKALSQLCQWSGFFPNEIRLGRKFLEVMKKAAKQVDILGVELEPFEDYYVRFEMNTNLEITFLEEIEPWRYAENPWSSALKGKKVLVIHPFADTIKRQYEKRENIYPGTEILPEFELTILKAVQTIAGEVDERFQDWFEALEWMYTEALKIDFDIAIIGCGAYGFPLAAKLKRAGKQAIHLGGATQLLFGIKGKRWETEPFFEYVRKFFNDSWVYPGENERPQKAENVEGGCYW